MNDSKHILRLLLLSLLIEAGMWVPLHAQLVQEDSIVFVSDRDGRDQIYMMDADGTHVHQLTDLFQYAIAPDWSPDGRQIAFVAGKAGNAEIYVIDADGSNPRNLTGHPALDGSPSWSPDGQRIAFHSNRDGNPEIYVMDVDGTNLRRLTNDPAPDGNPSWSPDGRRIAFESTRDGNREIYIMDAAGGDAELRRLTDNPEVDAHPQWSPDGQQIAIFSNRGELAPWGAPGGIYVINVESGHLSRLTQGQGGGYPSWSPDGQWIAFESDRDGKRDIYVMDAEGKTLRNLTRDPAFFDSDPDWFGPRTAQGISAGGKYPLTWGWLKSVIVPGSQAFR